MLPSLLLSYVFLCSLFSYKYCHCLLLPPSYLQIIQLPPAIPSYLLPTISTQKDMLAHPHSSQLKLAAGKEFNDLFAKNMSKCTDILSADQESPLPLLWDFKYKSDSDEYMTKHKARLCAKGDLK
jgi:hypothetical protein